MGRWSRALGCVMWVCVGCSTARKPEEPRSEQASNSPSPSAEPSPAATTGKSPPPPPPALTLQVLKQRTDVGLSIQNRGGGPEQLSSTIAIKPVDARQSGRDLRLTEDTRCLTLQPGGEWLWPQDWGLSLAPSQEELDGLEGSYRFAVSNCEGSAQLHSAPFELPLRYFGPSADGK